MDKNVYYETVFKEIQEQAENNKPLELYKKLQMITTDFQMGNWAGGKYEDGCIKSEKNEITEIWAEIIIKSCTQ